MEEREVLYAQLSEKKLKQLRKFEKKLGAWVLALQPAATLSELTEEQLARIQTLETELGVVLLAYDGESE